MTSLVTDRFSSGSHLQVLCLSSVTRFTLTLGTYTTPPALSCLALPLPWGASAGRCTSNLSFRLVFFFGLTSHVFSPLIPPFPLFLGLSYLLLLSSGTRLTRFRLGTLSLCTGSVLSSPRRSTQFSSRSLAAWRSWSVLIVMDVLLLVALHQPRLPIGSDW